MKFLQSHHLPHPLFILFYLTPNIPMYTSDNLSPPYLITHTSCNHVGDCTTSFPRLPYIALLAPMAFDSSILTGENNDATDHYKPSDIDIYDSSSWKHTA